MPTKTRPIGPVRSRPAAAMAALPPTNAGSMQRGLVSAVVLVLATWLCGGRAIAQEAVGRQADEAAVRAAARAYVEALERGDGKTLAGMWTPDGDIVDDDGRVTNGRQTVLTTASAADDASRPMFDLRETSLRFLGPDVAVEDGDVKVTPPGSGAVHTGHFTAIWVRQANAWKLAALRESRVGGPADAAKLADLEWMVGEWTAVEERTAAVNPPDATPADAPAMEVSVRWDEGHTFLLREMKVVRKTPAGQSAASHITQRIGWDPLSRQLRSWSFSSDGGHAESVWSREGDTWIARAMAVLPDGTQTSSINLYSHDGADRYTWRSLPTHVGGEHLPQVTMTMVRKQKGVGK